MGKLNRIQFQKDLFTKRNVESFVGFARSAANTRLVFARRALLEDFDEHLVTREIKGGSQDPQDQQNISSTLGGRGNLFTFIGFNFGENPIEELRAFIQDNIVQENRPEIKVSGARVSYDFITHYPNLEDIYVATPLPWASSSWVRGVEKGISGLANYIYWKFFEQSRSFYGLQASRSLRGIQFNPVDYMTVILNKFKAKFNK